MATVADEYYELAVATDCDPVCAAQSIVRRTGASDHVLYERAGIWTLAAGAAGEVCVEPGFVTARWRADMWREPFTDAPLAAVTRSMERLPLARWRAFGWVSFELAHLWSGIPPRGAGSLMHLMVPETEVTFAPGHVTIRSTSGELARDVAEQVGSRGPALIGEPRPVDVESDPGRAYQEAVAGAVRAIRAGRMQKVILSRHVGVPFPVDLWSTFRLARRNNTPARSFLVRLGGRAAAGVSPETVVEVAPDSRVFAQPLAGTRALDGSDEVDARLGLELTMDPKEVHEHAISVKSVCDDLHAVCTPESVHIAEFMSLKHRGSVQHLGSTVGGRLAPGRTAFDALQATFPAVTGSGLPRRAAYEYIAAHEDEPRDLYAGAVVTLASDGELDAALVLRTVFQANGTTWLRAGAGIVAGSRPEREFQETCEKLRSLSRFIVPARD